MNVNKAKMMCQNRTGYLQFFFSKKLTIVTLIICIFMLTNKFSTTILSSIVWKYLYMYAVQ